MLKINLDGLILKDEGVMLATYHHTHFGEIVSLKPYQNSCKWFIPDNEDYDQYVVFNSKGEYVCNAEQKLCRSDIELPEKHEDIELIQCEKFLAPSEGPYIMFPFAWDTVKVYLESLEQPVKIPLDLFDVMFKLTDSDLPVAAKIRQELTENFKMQRSLSNKHLIRTVDTITNKHPK